MTVQLGFPLPAKEPYSIHYLVSHSGISEAVALLEEAILKSRAQKDFSIVVLYGEKGSGKTHLIEAYKTEAISSGIDAELVSAFELSVEDAKDEERISAFISEYERIKALGGLLLVSVALHPGDDEINPHLKSRLLAGKISKLGRPKEEELPRVFSSLLQKRNMKLGDRSIDFLLRRIPANTLSFEAISDRLDEVFREKGRQAKFSVVREILDDEILDDKS